MQREKEIESALEESPGVLLGHELLFDFFKSLTTISITIIGGLATLFVALAPTALEKPKTLIGFGIIIIGAAFSVGAQLGLVQRLRMKTAHKHKSDHLIALAIITFVGVGTGFLGGRLANEISASGEHGTTEPTITLDDKEDQGKDDL